MTLVIPKTFLWNETVWNPSMISTALWLDAADNATVFSDAGTTQAVAGSSTVQQWNDKSGNRRHATQSTSGSRPTYSNSSVNSRNAVAFNGTSNLLDLAVNFTLTSFACFAVFSPSAKADSYIYYITPSNGNLELSLISRYPSNNYEFYQPNARRIISQAGAGQNIIYYERSGASVTPRFNGGSAITSATVNSADTVIVSHKLGAISYPSGGIPTQAYYQGTFCELLLLGSIPVESTRQRIEGYLAHKWGLEANLPNDHPYKSYGPKP